MIHFYGLSDRQVLEMPVTRFWLLNRSIDRIQAEKSIGAAMIAIQTQSSEGFSDLMSGLQKQLGKIVDMDPIEVAKTEELDRGGLHSLKGMGSIM